VTRHMNDFSDEFSDELEEKIAELVAAGCDRQELLSRLQLFLMAYAAGPESARGFSRTSSEGQHGPNCSGSEK
jgi:hypothetical protein